MPRSRDLAIFVPTIDDDRKKSIALPLAHARGVISTPKHNGYTYIQMQSEM